MPDLVQRRHLEVLDEHVGLLDETHEQLARPRAGGGRCVHDSLLRAIELFIAWRLYGRSSTPSIAGGAYIDSRLPSSMRGGRPRQVALRGGREHRWVLDPDHLGAEVGEQLGEVRARPHRGEVEDPDAAQRRLVGVARCPTRGRSLRVRAPTRAARLAGARRGAVQPPAALVVAVRRARAAGPSPSVRVVDVDPEARAGGSGRPRSPRPGVYTPGERPLPGLRLRGRLGAGVLEQPRVQRGVEDLLGLRVGERVGAGERRRVSASSSSTVEHLLELLRRRHHRHVAVGAGEDADGEERVGRVASARPSGSCSAYSQPR